MSDWPHAPAAADDYDDPSIPLLTDRIYLPAVELDTALPASLAPEEAAATTEAAAVADEGPPTLVEAELAEPEETASVPAGGERDAADAAIEVELDRDLVAASDADFDALLSAEPQVVGAEALPAASPVEESTAAAGAEEAPPAVAAAADEAEDTQPGVAAAADEAAIAAQAEALRAAVLQRVAARLPDQVNAAVRDLMQPAIDQAMASLGKEAEVALRITLQELVEQALREELSNRAGPPQS